MTRDQAIKEIVNIAKTQGKCDFDRILSIVGRIDYFPLTLDKWLYEQTLDEYGSAMYERITIKTVRDKIKELSDGK